MKRYVTARIISFSAAAVVVASGIAWQARQEAEQYKRYLNYGYMRAVSELVDSMSQISGTLQKGMYTSSPTLLMSMSAEIWRESYTAKSSVAQMPLSDVQLDRTSKFISQLGDYAFYIAKKAAAHEELNDEELKHLDELSTIAGSFTQELSTLKNDIYEGRIQFLGAKSAENQEKEADKALDGYASGSLEKLEEEFPEYATLIYDGPLSDHIDKLEPELLKGKQAVTIEEAKNRAAEFAALSPSDLLYAGEGGDQIKTYSFSADKNGQYYFDVCAAGGYVLNMSCTRDIDNENPLSAEEAVAKAKNFLSANGYPSMKESYYLETGGMLLINFAYVQDGVVVYPDLIKVGIALDNGQVVRFESRGYVMSHKTRELAAPAVTKEQAREKLDGRLSVDTDNLAVIPTDGQNEVLCYEFLASNDRGQRMIVYVNAQTGQEQRMLILLEQPNGTLTL